MRGEPSKHVSTLTRRLRHLEEKIQAAERSGEEHAYDKAEAAAILWALEVIGVVRRAYAERREKQERERRNVQGLRDGTSHG